MPALARTIAPHKLQQAVPWLVRTRLARLDLDGLESKQDGSWGGSRTDRRERTSGSTRRQRRWGASLGCFSQGLDFVSEQPLRPPVVPGSAIQVVLAEKRAEHDVIVFRGVA